MNLQDYISDTEKEYHLRVKTVVPLDDEAMDKVERVIAKYQPIDISKVTKTILQKHPLDFQNVDNAEVYIIDILFSLPVAPHMLRNDIRKVLKTSEEYVVVREINEPIEIETLRLDALSDINDEAKKLGLKPLGLLDSPDYAEVDEKPATDFYGDEYNSTFLSYLQDVRKERESKIVQPANPLFKFLDLPREEKNDEFNELVKDAPKVFPKKAKNKTSVKKNIEGAVDGSELTIKKTFTDKNGKRVILSRKLGEKE